MNKEEENSRTVFFKDDRQEDWAAIAVSIIIVLVIVIFNSGD